MRQPLSCLALALCAALISTHAAAPEPLFNGKDLSGWVSMHDGRFEAHDGSLRLVRGTGWLRTEKEYGDFVLEVELRPGVERYDSGLYFRAGLDGKPWPTDGWLVNLRRDMWGALVKGFTRILPSSVEGPDIDESTPWTKVRLEVRGSKATLDLDGKRLWETDKIDRPRGYIGIQAEERTFDFRQLRIEVFDTPAAKI
jgi:hypothetical protein